MLAGNLISELISPKCVQLDLGVADSDYQSRHRTTKNEEDRIKLRKSASRKKWEKPDVLVSGNGSL